MEPIVARLAVVVDSDAVSVDADAALIVEKLFERPALGKQGQNLAIPVVGDQLAFDRADTLQ
ncbi:hypothetical protein D3C86_1794920 [compost metagenome]